MKIHRHSIIEKIKYEVHFLNFNEVLKYIHEKEKLGSVFGLEAINELLFRLNNPEKGIKAIHIAGTNGKGSIMAFIEEALIQAGYKVGRYISPVIFDYCERWKLNKRWATEKEVSRVITEISKKVSDMIRDGYVSPTAFVIETAAAFMLFKEWDVDYMLIECGMGGRLDATNVIEEDVINVLASISMDHMNVLGTDISDITSEKLGIVRKDSTLITYPETDEVMNQIIEYTKENSVQLYSPDISKLSILDENMYGSAFVYNGNEYKINMGGHYQIYNAVTAIEALQRIQGLDTDIIRKGLEKTSWEARFEVINDNPVVIVDGAHNEDAWIKLRESLESLFTSGNITFIIGVLADKEYYKMIKILAPVIDKVYTVQSSNPRALSKETLAELFNREGIKAFPADNVNEAIKSATDNADFESDIIVVCGSLTITGEAIRYYKKINME